MTEKKEKKKLEAKQLKRVHAAGIGQRIEKIENYIKEEI